MDDYNDDELFGFSVLDFPDVDDELAYPDAGPVTVTRADGTVEVQDALDGGDQPQ